MDFDSNFMLNLFRNLARKIFCWTEHFTILLCSFGFCVLESRETTVQALYEFRSRNHFINSGAIDAPNGADNYPGSFTVKHPYYNNNTLESLEWF